jgi:CheY-like chemotaxis protein
LRTPTRILVVDDDPTNVEVLRVRLSAQGYEVVTAIDGEEGLQRACELEPDLVLLDVMMPKLDGISVLKELKADITLRFMLRLLRMRSVSSSSSRDPIGFMESIHSGMQGRYSGSPSMRKIWASCGLIGTILDSIYARARVNVNLELSRSGNGVRNGFRGRGQSAESALDTLYVARNRG